MAQKTILITGSTDGIGLETAKALVTTGHIVILHGRNVEKLKRVETQLSALGNVKSYASDLSDFNAVIAMTESIKRDVKQIDVLINNAGVFKTSSPVMSSGLDMRFVVNVFAPFILTQRLLPVIPTSGRVINLSSAAQAPVSETALKGETTLSDSAAYAQSKLAITMWTNHMARKLSGRPIFIAVNPGSLLGTNMVKDAYGMAGKDINIGVKALTYLALDPDVDNHNGEYFDNDRGHFGEPHTDALDLEKVERVTTWIEEAATNVLES